MDPKSETGAIGTIEIELLTLVRHLETLGRRSSLYSEVDRAGYLILRTLEQTGPLPTTVVATTLRLDTSTVTRQATALVAAGFVERLPNPADGRSSRLAITPVGGETMRGVERERQLVLQEMFNDWSDAELLDLGRSLTKLNVALIGQVAGSEGRVGKADQRRPSSAGSKSSPRKASIRAAR